jgi:hypothetical protein
MKKILLSIAFIGAVLLGRSQAVLNEIYFNPASGESEYIEIYNSGAHEDLNCYTLLIKYHVGSEEGFYVINYPNISLNSNTWSVTSSSLPFNYQSSPPPYNGGPSDFSWNSLNTAGTGGYFKQYKRTGSTYTETIPPVNTNDILQTLPSGDGAKYITLLYRDGILINGLIINGGTTVPVGLTGMPDLLLPSDGTGTCSGFTAHFSLIQSNQLEYMTPAIGASNGAFRTSDGKCGTWDKSSRPADNTPGSTNGPSTVTDNTVITVGGSTNCTLNPDKTRTATYFVVNSSTDAAAYPLVLQLYIDNGTTPTKLDASDEFVGQHTISTAPAPGDPNTNYTANISGNNNGSILVVAKSTAGCFQTISFFPNSCIPLPVGFKSFSAARNHSNVLLKWETSFEQNSNGFAIERNIRGTWEQVAFVPSQAAGGNSVDALAYMFVDFNNVNGISQYRIKQVDFDAKFKFSDIRAVRGESQAGNTIVYPNPSFDGRVNIVFEDATVARDASLSDMAGRILKQWKGVTNNNIQIDNLTPGMYSLRIVVPETGEQSVQKIIVSRR